MADPKDHKPEHHDPNQPPEVPAFEFPEELGLSGPAADAGPAEPLAELGFDASQSDVNFPSTEELDFTEPADFSFPSEVAAEGEVPPELEGVSEEVASADGGLRGSEEEVMAEPALGEDEVPEPELAGEGIEPVGEESIEEGELAEAVPKSRIPAWLGPAQWVLIGTLALAAVIVDIVAVGWVKNPHTFEIIWNVSFPVLLLLIPYALWRAKNAWVTPEITASYTVLLSLGAAALLCGVYFMGLELLRYNWDVKAKTAKAPIVAAPVAAAQNPGP